MAIQDTTPARRSLRADLPVYGKLAGIALLWWAAYSVLLPVSQWLTYSVLGLARGSQLGESVAFFLYDVPKILLLLAGMIFLISIVRTFFSPERTRALLGGKRQGLGNVLAATLGIVTPFCSCSAVPLFIGFVESGIPLGVTFSFLIAAPLINEVAVIMLGGLFGWRVAALYIGTGLVIAIVAGIVIGRFHLERYVEDFVWQLQMGAAARRSGPPGRSASAAPRTASRRSSARSGPTSSSALGSAQSSMASCPRAPWRISWASRRGGACRRPCCWASPCIPTRRGSSLLSAR